MSGPLAYFLTWSTYGAWLHGDARGSVDRDHNIPGTPFVPPDEARRDNEHQSLVSRPVALDLAARRVVDDTIVAHCRIRNWTLLARNVRSKHVHVVVDCRTADPDRAMEQFKAWATRRLREAGMFAAEADIWTPRGSRRYLWDEESVANSVTYVQDMQGDDLI